MATRALVGFIQGDAAGNLILTSTYNHYDGYPDNLGKGLDNFYSEPNEALKIASMGYISYLDPETGEIEAKHKEPAEETVLPDNFEEAMFRVAEKGDEYGADYVYIYNVETLDWVHAENTGIRNTAYRLMNKLADYKGGVFPDSGDEMNEDYNAKWKNFLNNEGMDFPGFEGTSDQLDSLSLYNKKPTLSQIISQAMFKLQDEPEHMIDAYKKSLANDIRLNGPSAYADYSVEDFVEDYENYIADKMDM